MKKAMVYIIALTLAFSALLAGCGEIQRTDRETTSPTATPKITSAPESMMPDPEDGVVRDEDGIITEEDNGSQDEKTPVIPHSTPIPGSGSGNTGGSAEKSGKR